MQPQPATQQVAMPGFTAEQTALLQAMITAAVTVAVKEALDKQFSLLQSTQLATQATQLSIPPAPQAKKEEVKKPRPQPLY